MTPARTSPGGAREPAAGDPRGWRRPGEISRRNSPESAARDTRGRDSRATRSAPGRGDPPRPAGTRRRLPRRTRTLDDPDWSRGRGRGDPRQRRPRSAWPATSGRTATRSGRCSRWRTRCGSRAGAAGQPPIIASFGDQPFEIPRDPALPARHRPAQPAGRRTRHRPQVMVTFDAAQRGPARHAGGLRRARRSELIVLDHHASNTRFGTLHLIDPAAAATAVLADDLIGRLGVPITRDIAFGLYAGHGHRHRLVQVLHAPRRGCTSSRRGCCATGIDPGAVALELWDTRPVRLPAACCPRRSDRAVLEPDAAAGYGLVWTTVSRADRAAYGLPYRRRRVGDRRAARAPTRPTSRWCSRSRRRPVAWCRSRSKGKVGRGPRLHRGRAAAGTAARPGSPRRRHRRSDAPWPALRGAARGRGGQPPGDRRQRAGHRRQARRADLARRRGPDPPAGRHPPGRARRARSTRWPPACWWSASRRPPGCSATSR